MAITMSLGGKVPNTRLAQLSLDFRQDLSRAGVHAEAIEGPAVPGARGGLPAALSQP